MQNIKMMHHDGAAMARASRIGARQRVMESIPPCSPLKIMPSNLHTTLSPHLVIRFYGEVMTHRISIMETPGDAARPQHLQGTVGGR